MASKKRVTLKTISDQCGYSVNTVSRALRNDSRLSPQTVAKIHSIADKLGYIRNTQASSLRSGRSNLIAIIVDDILNQHYSLLISEIDTLLRKNGYQAMVLCTYLCNELVSQTVNMAISNSVDGILFFPFINSSAPIKRINDHNIPLVLVDREMSEFSTDSICCNDYDGGYLAGKELCRLGHQKFLYAAGPSCNGSQIQREAGFRQALLDHGVSTDSLHVVSSYKITKQKDQNALMKMLLPMDYTAIFTFNDQTAYMIQNCLLALNYHIPRDVSLMGFDYIRQGFPYLPPLTSVACKSIQDMAQIAVTFLLRRIENSSLPLQREVLPVKIYDGGTVSTPPQ